MKELKLLLVNPSEDNPTPSLGLCYLSAYLKKYSEFKNIELHDRGTQDIFSGKSNPDIIGITSTTKDYKKAKEYADFAKKKYNVPILIGGAHISTTPLDLDKSMDIGIIGEGEETLLELMRLYNRTEKFNPQDLEKIKGICFHDNGEIKINLSRELIKDIDTIPFPDLDLVNMKHYLKPRQIIYGYLRKSMVLLTSRGCPYHCSFCSTSEIWKRFRGNSAEYVIEHIKWIYKKYKPKVIQIFDDLFVLDKKRLEKIVIEIEKEKLNKKIIFGCLCRADSLDDKTIILLNRMNVRSIAIGMESASQSVLNYLKNKTTKVEQLHNAVELCKKYKIKVFGSFMLGNLNETKEDLLETLKFIKAHPSLGILNYITTPLPKTKLWNEAIEKGKITKEIDINSLPMDIPEDFHEFEKLPILIDMDKKEFYDICMQFQKEFYSRLGKNYSVGTSFLSLDLIKRGIKKPKKAMKVIVQKIFTKR